MTLKHCLAIVPWILGTASAFAATITVTSPSDSGPGSLRAAIASAASGDTIDFSVTGVIVLSTELGLGSSDKELTIRGPGADQLKISGNNAVRVFRIAPRNAFAGYTISGLTIADGAVTNPNNGGGILLDSGVLTLVNCVVTNNSAQIGGGILANLGTRLTVLDSVISSNRANTLGGGVAALNGAIATEVALVRSTVSGNQTTLGDGGGVHSAVNGVFNIINCRFTSNTAANSGGGIFTAGTLAMQGGSLESNQGTRGGGGIANTGNSTLTEVTLNGNTATTAEIGGGVNNSGTLTVLRSTLSGNSAGAGGAINNSGTLTVTNSTLSGNASTGSGVSGGAGAINNSGSNVTVTSCTIVGNTSASTAPGGITNNGGGASATCRNTLIAQNTNNPGGPGGPDVRGTFVSAGNNLIGNVQGSTGFTIGTNEDKIGGGPGNPVLNPLLDPLADNGGPTRTHALQLGSPAIDSGDPGLGVATDQRGFPRYTLASAGAAPGRTGSDIGAFEYGNTALRITSITRPSDGSIIVTGIGLPNALHSVQTTFDLTTGFTTLGPIFSDGSGNLQFEDSDASSLTKRFYRFTFP